MKADKRKKKKSARPGRKPKARPKLPNLARKLKDVVGHVLPGFAEWLEQLPDPRDPTRTVYGMRTIVWSALFLFLFQLRSRRHFRTASDSPAFRANLNRLSGEQNDAVPHPDTVAGLLTRIPPEEFNRLPAMIVRELQRRRMLERYRLHGYYLVAVDGTGIFSFHQRHCQHCLTQKKKKGTIYYHKIEEAKLVSPGGLALSIGSESIENPEEGVTVQDCELRAFYRMAPKIKEAFPHTKICLLLDGLYANEQVFAICKKHHWKYIITFKEGSMPKTFEEYETLLRLRPENTVETFWEGRKQVLRWVTDLAYQRHRLNVLECKETGDDGGVTRFVWLTNLEVTGKNVTQIANEGGRCRWIIENQGFNVQKNCEFQLEHVFTRHEEAWKTYYSILQVAHIIFQLLYWWRALREVRQYLTSIYAFARRLLEHFRIRAPEPDGVPPPAFQLRLDTS